MQAGRTRLFSWVTRSLTAPPRRLQDNGAVPLSTAVAIYEKAHPARLLIWPLETFNSIPAVLPPSFSAPAAGRYRTVVPNGDVIPGQASGGSGGGAFTLGTSSYPFSGVYTNNVYINGDRIATSVAPSSPTGACTPSIGVANNTAAFTVLTGIGTCGSTLGLTMPAAGAGWICDAVDEAGGAAFRIQETADSTNSVTFTGYSIGSGPGTANSPLRTPSRSSAAHIDLSRPAITAHLYPVSVSKGTGAHPRQLR